MKKSLIYALSLALLLSLAACHKPQEDQPTEPDPPQAATSTQADVSTPEPLASPEPEPPEQAPAHPDQLSDTTPAAPDEVEDTEPSEETAPEKTAPAEQAEQPLEATPPTTEPVAQQPTSKPSGGGQSNPSGQTQQPETSQQPIAPQQSADSSGLTPEELSEAERIMKEQVLKNREEAKANGWSVGEGDPLTDEDIEGIGSILNGG